MTSIKKTISKLFTGPGGALLIILMLAFLGGLAYAADITTHPDYYRIYTLDSHYIGDIKDGETQYNDVYIMDVTPYRTATNTQFTQSETLTHALNQSSLIPGNPHRLYFAGEHSTRRDLLPGNIIITRWAHTPAFNRGYHISGVWSLPGYVLSQVNPTVSNEVT